MVAKGISIFAAFVVTLCCYGEVRAMRWDNPALAAAAAASGQVLADISGVPVDAPNFPHVGALDRNARPRRYSLRERITEEMFRMLCAYVFAVLFTRTQMHCQIYCSFWVYPPWLSSLFDGSLESIGAERRDPAARGIDQPRAN